MIGTLKSMTGFAASSCILSDGRLACEIRSVNSRFLDLTFRMADELRGLEPALRERISAAVGRGKLECRIAWQRGQRGSGRIDPDPATLARLASLEAAVRLRFPEAAPLSVDAVLRWPGVLPEATTEATDLQDDLLGLVDTVLSEFNASREREGERLGEVIGATVGTIRDGASAIQARLPELNAAQQQRVTQRLSDVLAGAGAALAGDELQARLRQEVSVLGLRNDVAEELARLQTHLDEVDRVLRNGGAVGKRLDFLCQELNREANTLASKAQLIEQTRAAVDLKLSIEQIREQVQNIE